MVSDLIGAQASNWDKLSSISSSKKIVSAYLFFPQHCHILDRSSKTILRSGQRSAEVLVCGLVKFVPAS